MPRSENLATYFLDRNLVAGRARRTALITRDGSCSYEELAALTNRAGNVLLELGVRAQERVLLAVADSVEFVAAWYGAQKVGAVTAEVYTFLPAKDYAYFLDYTGASVVVVDRDTLPRMREAAAATRPRPVMLVVGAKPEELRPGEASFDVLVDEASSELVAATKGPDDVAIWKFTTGSTGRPKACVHPSRSPVASYLSYALGVLDLSADDLVLPAPKLFFGYARDLAALYPFGVGGAGIVFPERTTPDVLFDLIARHRPSILVNVPTMMQAMLDHHAASEQDLSCLRLCTSAGEALPEPLHRRWMETFGVQVLDGMGSSEAYHIFISSRPGRVRPGSIGEAVPGYSIELIDDDGLPLHDGRIGRIRVRGESIARMYWGDPGGSANAFDRGLVKTGDLAQRDSDGYFWYRGRSDDLLKVGGIWVAPLEIEHCLAEHTGIAESAVVGVDREGLTRICAFVVARAGAHPSSEALRAFVRARLSGHKVPHEVHMVSQLPKTGSGKIDHRALRDAATTITTGVLDA